MRIKVVLLGQYREAVANHEFSLEIPPGATAHAAVATVRGRARSDVIPAHPVVAINQVHSDLDQILLDGDELALLPPVAGG